MGLAAFADGVMLRHAVRTYLEKPYKIMERETGIGPATNSLEGCDSTTELLPPEKPGADEGA